MELKRILAKDSRRALEKVSDEYGDDALVISSAKVNGQTEVIVAIDLHSENSTDSVETTDSTKKEISVPKKETNQSFEKFLKQEILSLSVVKFFIKNSLFIIFHIGQKNGNISVYIN